VSLYNNSELPLCDECGQENRRAKTGLCSRCYMQYYRERPGTREAHRARVKAYVKKNPDKYREWKRRSDLRSGHINPPALTALRRAAKRLEMALAVVSQRVRRADQRRGDGPAE